MNFFAHFVTGISLFFGSLFGLHAGVTSSTSPVVPANATVAASTTVTAPVKTSFFGKVAALVAPKESAPTAVPAPLTSAAAQTSSPGTTTQPVSVGTATVDQTRVVFSTPGGHEETNYATNTELTGTASNASSVTVAFVPISQGDTSWAAVSAGTQSRMQTATVSDGKWLVDFRSLGGDIYTVLVYDNATHVLLYSKTLQVQNSGQSNIPAYNIPVTIGLGQSASDGIFTVHLKSISGPASAPTATLSFDLQGAFAGQTFTVKAGDQLPKAGVGFDFDVVTYVNATNVLIKEVSFATKTVTFTIRPIQSTARPF